MSSFKLQDIVNLVTFSKDFCSHFYSLILTYLQAATKYHYMLLRYACMCLVLSTTQKLQPCACHTVYVDRFCVFVMSRGSSKCPVL